MTKLKALAIPLLMVIAFFGCSNDDTDPIVPEPLKVEKVALVATAKVKSGETITLISTITPTDAANKTLTWSTDNADIATVSDAGIVSAIAEGDVNITATATDGSQVAATCKVTVKPAPIIDYIKVNYLRVAKGNLVADGKIGCKIGTSEDETLYFQFGSLIGWSGETLPAIVVKPASFNGSEDLDSPDKIWERRGNVPFTERGSIEEQEGMGDPCRYYLKGNWRLPTIEEFSQLFDNGGDLPYSSWRAEGKFDRKSQSYVVHTSGLKLEALGMWSLDFNNMKDIGVLGYYWTSSPMNGDPNAYGITFYENHISPASTHSKWECLSVRCVQ